MIQESSIGQKKIWSQCYYYSGRFRSVGTHRIQALPHTLYELDL